MASHSDLVPSPRHPNRALVTQRSIRSLSLRNSEPPQPTPALHMSLVSSPEGHKSSLPPFPQSEEYNVEPWSDRSPSRQSSSESSRGKGKERQFEDYPDAGSDGASDGLGGRYPPTNDEDEETRRVEEVSRSSPGLVCFCPMFLTQPVESQAMASR